ncbi:MAG TPA: Fic/DOC family N-terminal domain-containing protein, partial [Ktedonobacterales bacterium]
MKASDFRTLTSGRLVPTVEGQLAYVPAPLPPDIAYDTELILRLSKADVALSELAGVGRYLPNPHLLISPYIRREAILSTRIEGTQATFSEVLRDEVIETPKRGSTDLREVNNYVASLEYGVARLDQLPISLRLVCELHERLLAGVRGEATRPGEFRQIQNFIGLDHSRIADAMFVPPPPAEMMDALYDWERFVHMRDALPDLIQCA